MSKLKLFSYTATDHDGDRAWKGKVIWCPYHKKTSGRYAYHKYDHWVIERESYEPAGSGRTPEEAIKSYLYYKNKKK